MANISVDQCTGGALYWLRMSALERGNSMRRERPRSLCMANGSPSDAGESAAWKRNRSSFPGRFGGFTLERFNRNAIYEETTMGPTDILKIGVDSFTSRNHED